MHQFFLQQVGDGPQGPGFLPVLRVIEPLILYCFFLQTVGASLGPAVWTTQVRAAGICGAQFQDDHAVWVLS